MLLFGDLYIRKAVGELIQIMKDFVKDFL